MLKLLVGLCLAACTTCAHADPQFMRGRVLIETQKDVQESELQQILAPHRGKAERIGKTNLFIVRLPPKVAEVEVRNALAKNPRLKFAELDAAVKPLLVPNDPRYGAEWHLPKVNAPAAWDTTLGAGITIAILDTGVDASHPDLAANIVPGWNFWDNNSNTLPVVGGTGAVGHGTWVAGVAAAITNNALGVASVAGSAKIMPIRVTDSASVGYWSLIAQGITYAIDHGARLANASFDNMLLSSTILSAAQYMKNHNGLVTFPAGNSGTDLGFAPTTSAISVSATTPTDAVATWSSFGSYVSLSAPGEWLWTTDMAGGYTQGLGTSFSSPVVAAVAALMMSARPDLSSTQIEGILFSSATDLGASGKDPYYGYGRVDAAAAVLAALAVAADTSPPTVTITSPADGSVVPKRVTVSMTASDDSGPTALSNKILIDGALKASGVGTSLSYRWNTQGASRGTHLIEASSEDASRNKTSKFITVTK